MTNQGYQVRFNKYGCFVEEYINRKAGNLLAKGSIKGRLFSPSSRVPCIHSEYYAKNPSNQDEWIELWHCHIDHVNYQRLKKMQTHSIVRGLPKFGRLNFDHVCEACQIGKQPRTPIPKRGRKESRYPLELVHTNIWGPCHHATPNGCCYYITFVDDFSYMTWIYFLEAKLKAFETFLKF